MEEFFVYAPLYHNMRQTLQNEHCILAGNSAYNIRLRQLLQLN